MSDTSFVVGIDVGGTKTAMACQDLAGNLLDRQRIPTGAERGADAALGRIIESCGRMISDIDGTLAAIGVASPGVVKGNRILLAPNNPGWDTLDLPERLSQLGTAVIAIDNDVKAGALAEARKGALTGISSGIYLNLGTGIAAALVIDGMVLRGAHGASGEIGYQLVDRTPFGPPPDRSAPLESYVAGTGIARRASSLLGETVSADQALDRLGTQQNLDELLYDAFDTLAVHLTNLAIATDPARVAVGGGMVASRERFFPHLNRVLQACVPYPPELVVAHFADDAALRGALMLATDAAHKQSDY